MAASSPPLPLGSAAPALALPTLRDRMQSLEALRGKVVIVHFFATWCEPCREEMAGLSRLVARIGDGPVALLAVDVGEPELRVRRFFEKQPVPFPILLDEDRAAMKAWSVAVLPTSFVLDASHVLRLYAGGPVDWDDPSALPLLERLATPAGVPPEGVLPPLNE
ncbi:TlpA disulfide reductase family protein [Ancylobacter sp. VNQ12]|uniref:TlpA disulfide reductase family protein n=1 Tax=Ancylobacter sp. VNQ12 TaxID=3400920 RepID=UPI003C0F3081